MPFPPRFRAVIFDMDGLMLDTEVISREIWKKASADIGRTISDELFARFIGRKEDDCAAILQELWGPAFSYPVLHERILIHWAERLTQGAIPYKVGLVALLDLVDSLGLPKAVATSSHRDGALNKLGDLAGRFQVLVTGDEVEHGKPAPDIFLLAAFRLGLAPRDCLVLEDSWAGTQAAIAAGAYPITVPDLIPAHEQAPHVARSLSEVEIWLRNHFSPTGVTP